MITTTVTSLEIQTVPLSLLPMLPCLCSPLRHLSDDPTVQPIRQKKAFFLLDILALLYFLNLLDLLQLVGCVGTALDQFKCSNCKGVADAGIKHLKDIPEALYCIHLTGTKQVERTSKIEQTITSPWLVMLEGTKILLQITALDRN